MTGTKKKIKFSTATPQKTKAHISAKLTPISSSYLIGGYSQYPKGGLDHFPPKFAHFLVPVITFFPFFLCK